MRPHIAGIEIHVDPFLGWQCWRMGWHYNLMGKPTEREWFVMGPDAWAALDFDLNVKPLVLECDPGPLDAKVS